MSWFFLNKTDLKGVIFQKSSIHISLTSLRVFKKSQSTAMDPRISAGMVAGNLRYNQGDVPADKTVGGMNTFETPGYFTFLEKDYNALKSGGITTSIISDQPNREIVSPVVCQTRCAALRDNSQQLFERGDFLFAYNSEAKASNETILFNLQTLNYWLEEAFVLRNENRMMDTLDPERSAQFRKRKYGSDLLYSFPLTIEEFKKKIVFIGIMIGANGVREIRSREISYSPSGLVRDVPNIFGPVEEDITLEFRVKRFKNRYHGKIHYEGTVTKDVTHGSFLQVRPYVNRNKHPVIHHRFEETSEDDVDFMEQVIVKQVILDNTNRLPNGLIRVDNNATSERIIMDVELPVEGLCYTIGSVQQFKRTTNQNEANIGIRSIPAVTKIAKDGGLLNIVLNVKRNMLTQALDDS